VLGRSATGKKEDLFVCTVNIVTEVFSDILQSSRKVPG